MQGGLSGLGTWEFAAAVSKTGADGCLTAAVSRTPERLREDIQKLRAEVNHFTVNITIGMCPHIEEMFEVCVEEEIPTLETAVYRPDDYMDYIRKAKSKGVAWVHKASTVRHIKHAEKLGADAVVIVGLDGYGFKNIRQLPTFTAIPWALRQVNVPLVAAGGIGDARTFLSALAAGAEGVYMGTAFMGTKECPLTERIKENMVKALPDHIDLIRELVAPPNPEEYKAVMEARNKMPFERWIPAVERVHLKHREWRDVAPMWEEAEGLLRPEAAEVMPSLGTRPKGPFSFACGYINRIVTCKELVDGIIGEAEEILGKWVKQFKLTEL